MNDSADMKQARLADAANALQSALGALEKALDPMLVRLESLETKARESEGLSEDRAKLAAQLDEALEARRQREAEFEALSKQTRNELDQTIQALKEVMAGSGSGDSNG
jgi:low affinity Fe/Cu permease